MSPLRLPIPPPGLAQQFSAEISVVLPDAFSARWRTPHPTPAATRILTRNLVCPAPELRLERKVASSLYRRQKGCQLLLFGFDQGVFFGQFVGGTAFGTEADVEQQRQHQ